MNLFTEFAPASKAAWLAQINKDLKGKSINDLFYKVGDLSIAPFLTQEDLTHDTAPLTLGRTQNHWEINENIPVQDDFKKANSLALNALNGGASALRFEVESFPTPAQLAVLLKDIELDYIHTVFAEKSRHQNPLPFLKSFKQYILDLGKNPLVIQGGIDYAPIAEEQDGMKTTAELLLWTEEHLPHFRVLTVRETYQENVVNVLTQLIQNVIEYLEQIAECGVAHQTIANKVQFSVYIGTRFFVEIAKIRALKLLWGNVLAHFGVEATLPFVTAITRNVVQENDLHTSKIRAASQAMSAAMAGANVLTVTPSDADEAQFNAESSAFNRRIARNVQHLLQSESSLNHVVDPAAGSYFVETLTQQLAEAVWKCL